MNLRNFYNQISRSLDFVNFEIKEETADKMVLQADLQARDHFDDDVLVKIVSFASGTLHVFFTFDHLDKNLRNYELINDFNTNTSWFSAYIKEGQRGNFFLEIHYATVDNVTEDIMAESVEFAFDQLLNEDSFEYLRQLTQVTY